MKPAQNFRLGILMLDTTFPRIPGDVGNPKTWPCEVHFETARGVGVDDAVRNRDPRRYTEPFLQAAQRLESRGVSLITTSCGFLILLQDRLREAVRVPVLTSSLLQVPHVVQTIASGAKIGIMTFEGPSLSRDHLAAAGIDPRIVAIAGLEGTEFHRTIREDLSEFDPERALRDHIAVAKRLVTEHCDIRAIVFECHNMPPYAAAVREVTGLPVYDVTTLIFWAAAALGMTSREGFAAAFESPQRPLPSTSASAGSR
jgi:Asp/Glu/hydantoin racemase